MLELVRVRVVGELVAAVQVLVEVEGVRARLAVRVGLLVDEQRVVQQLVLLQQREHIRLEQVHQLKVAVAFELLDQLPVVVLERGARVQVARVVEHQVLVGLAEGRVEAQDLARLDAVVGRLERGERRQQRCRSLGFGARRLVLRRRKRFYLLSLCLSNARFFSSHF